jgi:hypothetical protein
LASIPEAACIMLVRWERAFQITFSRTFGGGLSRSNRNHPRIYWSPAIISTVLSNGVRPELVPEVEYTSWSGSGRVRHAVYLGLREDKSPEGVIRDIADPAVERTFFQGGGSRGTRLERCDSTYGPSHHQRSSPCTIADRDGKGSAETNHRCRNAAWSLPFSSASTT